MPKFKYVAIDPSGAKVTGVVEAASAVRVRNELAGRELRTVEVTERKSLARVEITTKKLKPVDLMNFSRQFAAFLRAGIPILDALQALVDETANAQLKAVLIDISDALRSGSTLSDAMASHENVFPSYYIGILRSAELTGNLDVVLDQLSGYIERDLEREACREVRPHLPHRHHVHGPVHGGGARRLRAPEVRRLLQELRRQASAPHPDASQLLPLREQLVVRLRADRSSPWRSSSSSTCAPRAASSAAIASC